MTVLANPYRFRIGADTAIGRFLGDEPSGLAIDFTTGQALVRDQTTPVVSFIGAPTDLLAYTAPSPKLVYGPAGTLRSMGHNVLLRSQEFNSAPWTVDGVTVAANAIAAPDGTLTADKLTESNTNAEHRVYQSGGGGSVNMVWSLYAKAAGRDWVAFRGWGGTRVANFNLATGTVGTVAGTGVTAAIQPAGNGWYRCIMYAPAVASDGVAINLGNGDTGSGVGFAYSGNGTSGVYLWGMQFETGFAATGYLPTTTAARYALPLDYDPVTLVAGGLLIEEQRTNVVLQSQSFDNVSWWTANGTAITANAILAPDGMLTAEKVAEVAGGGEHRIYQGGVSNVSTAMTTSLYAKAGERGWIAMRGGSAQARVANFNVAAGVVGTVSAGTTATIQSVGNGWYRCTMQGNGAATPEFLILSLGDADTGTGGNYAYTGVAGNGLYLWGVQLEAGAFPTSYIPTTTAQVTRSADNVTLPVTAFPFNASAGTAEFEGTCLIAGKYAVYGSFYSGGWQHSIEFVLNGGAQPAELAVYSGSVLQAYLSDLYAHSPGSLVKLAGAWSPNDFATISNGAGTVVTDTLGTVPLVTTLQLGGSAGGPAGSSMIGHLARLKYLPRRATNAELQAMVA